MTDEILKRLVKEPSGPNHAVSSSGGATLCGKNHLGWVITPEIDLQQFSRSGCCVYCLTEWVRQDQSRLERERISETRMSVEISRGLGLSDTRSLEEIEHDDLMMAIHRKIREAMKKHEFTYATGSYTGLNDAKMRFQRYEDIIEISVRFRGKK